MLRLGHAGHFGKDRSPALGGIEMPARARLGAVQPVLKQRPFEFQAPIKRQKLRGLDTFDHIILGPFGSSELRRDSPNGLSIAFGIGKPALEITGPPPCAATGQIARQIQRRVQRVALDKTIAQPRHTRVIGCYDLSGKHELQRSLRPDDAWQPLRGSPARDQAQCHLWQGQPCLTRGHACMCRQRQFEPRAQNRAMQTGHHRFGRVFDQGAQIGNPWTGKWPVIFRNIDTRRKSVARTTQHHSPHHIIGHHVCQNIAQFGPQRRGQRIGDRAIQSDESNTITQFVVNF